MNNYRQLDVILGEYYVRNGKERVINPDRVVDDAIRQIEEWKGHPGPVRLDISAIAGKPMLPLEPYLSNRHSRYGTLTGIVEQIENHCKRNKLEMEVHWQRTYGDVPREGLMF